jgi:Ca-activated chloride channel family protein
LFGLALFALAAASAFTGCGGRRVRVLAGSELKDLEPLFDRIEDETGLTLEMTYTGTLDGAERIMAGEDFDMAWFSHAKYLSLLEGTRSSIVAQERTMLSPVVLGVRESLARRWGWDSGTVSWADVAGRVASGELVYGMTNPTSSNSGFTALVCIATALSGSSDALGMEDVEAVQDTLGSFFEGLELTSGSSGWLADAYITEQDQIDGIFNYESVLLDMNRSGDLHEDLVLLYPSEGVVTADYPLMLLDAGRREDFEALVACIRSPEFQQLMMDSTLRRPVIPDVRPSSAFPTDMIVEMSFPGELEVVNSLLFAYLDVVRQPPHAVFVLDVSGSMQGERLAELKTAICNLTGVDRSLTGQFARFRDREMVSVITFDDAVRDTRTFEVDIDDPSSLDQIRGYVNSLQAGGNTAIYSALAEAMDLVRVNMATDTSHYYSIVLMSDGENNSGISPENLASLHAGLPLPVRRVHVFPILFGEADRDALEEIAGMTGGRVFDARSTDLGTVFKHIRGYQ